MTTLATLVIWLCTSASMTDCQVHAADQFEGPQAVLDCRNAANLQRARMPGHNRFICEFEDIDQ